MEYRAEKSTDTNALSCIVKIGRRVCRKERHFHIRRASPPSSTMFKVLQKKKKKLQVSFARVCQNSLRDGESKSAGIFNYLCKYGIGGTEIDSQFLL